jgi:hypothetical protein
MVLILKNTFPLFYENNMTIPSFPTKKPLITTSILLINQSTGRTLAARLQTETKHGYESARNYGKTAHFPSIMIPGMPGD